MSYAAPGIHWDLLHDDAARDEPAVEVPAELSALGDRERELLAARLAWSCGVPSVVVRPGERSAITFVGPTAARVTGAFRRAANDAVATVAADAAAGWTADDERERHQTFSWD